MESLISLRDPAIGEKQWIEIKELFNTTHPNSFINIDDVLYTLDYLIKIDFKFHHNSLQEIALRAAKEADLIKMLELVEATWKSAFILLLPYKDSKDLNILASNDELISKIDDTLLVPNFFFLSH
jgi:hypothetical protein